MTSHEHESRSRDLLQIVNASGFAFQLGLEQRILAKASIHGWRVVSREHAWAGDEGETGFADLILAKNHIRLVIESKRVLDGTWIFLDPGSGEPEALLRVQWSDAEPNKRDLIGIHDFLADPPTPQAAFCTVRGSGERDRPMLERVATGVLQSLGPLAQQELDLPASRSEGVVLIHVPVIVTNASLVLCRFHPANVDVDAGILDEGEFEAVPYLRFRKSLAFHPAFSDRRQTLTEAAANKERSIIVSSASAFTDLLARLEVPLPPEKRWPGVPLRVIEGL